MKRMLDVVCSLLGLAVLSPFLAVAMILVWLQDFHSPIYVAERVGKDSRTFQIVKLRSMAVNADKIGVDSTSSNDPRITSIGCFIRKFKLDEFTQLWNVLKGDMSLAGPRPNVKRETDLYSDVEKELLSIKPGITDFSSIVFSDENDILKDSKDPDIDYNQLIRPWKSRLGLLYIKHQSFLMDCILVFLAAVVIVSRKKALWGVNKLLNKINAPPEIINVSKRKDALVPFPPPGFDSVVTSRSVDYMD